MRYIVSLVTALAGMTMGLVLTLILNGLPTTGEMFRWGVGGGAIALLTQFAILNIGDTSSGPLGCSVKQAKPIQRTESQGSFSDRMERFAQNVDAAPIDPDKKPKAEVLGGSGSRRIRTYTAKAYRCHQNAVASNPQDSVWPLVDCCCTKPARECVSPARFEVAESSYWGILTEKFDDRKISKAKSTRAGNFGP